MFVTGTLPEHRRCYVGACATELTADVTDTEQKTPNKFLHYDLFSFCFLFSVFFNNLRLLSIHSFIIEVQKLALRYDGDVRKLINIRCIPLEDG